MTVLMTKHELIEQKFRAALTANRDLIAQRSLLLALVDRLCTEHDEASSCFANHLTNAIPEVVSFFQLDKKSELALMQMAKLTFVGLKLYPNAKPSDPYAFEQTQWLLKQSDSLSVLAVAMCLSLEKLDGSGPQGLDFELTPPLSIAYRCMLIIAQNKIKYDDITLMTLSIDAALKTYLPKKIRTDFVEALGLVHTPSKIEWVEVLVLRPGMTVMEDVRNSEGLLLIARNTKLTLNLIDSLLAYDGLQGTSYLIPVQLTA